MRLCDFLPAQSDAILSAWVRSIRGNPGPTDDLSDAALRDDARLIVTALANALRETMVRPHALDAIGEAARAHALNRVTQGFALDQIIEEFRVFRSDVVRRWTLEVQDFSRESHDEQVRFNDLVDHALAVSTAHYAMRLERARDLFLGVLGHDLRTPLAAVAHSAALLHRADASSEQRGDAIERITKSAQRMDLMIQDLLDFTRSRLGTQLPMNPTACDLEEVARQALDELAASHPGATVAFNACGDLHGTWDRERVIQLLSNLVDNAIRHHTGNSPVTVALRGECDQVEISVHNLGQVIAPCEQKAIFDPLRRGMHENQLQAPPAGTAGLGLGLYIAQQIAVAHGGQIGLRSNVADGTWFVTTLARGAGPRAGAPAAPAKDSPLAASRS